MRFVEGDQPGKGLGVAPAAQLDQAALAAAVPAKASAEPSAISREAIDALR